MFVAEYLVIAAVVILLMGPYVYREFVGPVCPNCGRRRMRCTGQTLFLPHGSMPTWKCKHCGARYCQAELDAIQRRQMDGPHDSPSEVRSSDAKD